MTANGFFRADSFDLIQNIGDWRFDLIITDPLYDLKVEQISWLHSKFMRLLNPDGTIIVFMPAENPWMPTWDQKLYWTKPISTKNTSRRYSRFVEEIFIYQFGDYTWNTEYHWSNYTNIMPDLVDTLEEHKWRKPPSLIERLIRNHSNPGDWVFDPFAGSNVVGETCEKLGRNSVTVDIASGETPIYAPYESLTT